VGLAVGLLWGLGWSGVSRRVAALALAMALGWSVVSLTTLAWVVPEANQAYRVARAGFVPSRGVREIPMADLRRMLDAPESIPAHLRRSVAWTYYQYWALAFAPVALTLFALSVARRRLRTRWQVGLTGAGAIWLYYALMWGARDLRLDLAWSPAVAAWLANGIFILWSLAYWMRAGRSAPTTAL
jgi:lipopolysaccharide export LptBFGC system permease protein LptF